MLKIGIPSNKYQKWQKRPGEVGKSVFVFKYFQTDDYGMSSGGDEENYVYNWSGRFENVWIHIHFSRRCPDFLVIFEMFI